MASTNYLQDAIKDDPQSEISRYYKAFDNPNENADVIRKGVASRPPRANLSYGDTVIVPELRDAVPFALDLLKKAGDVASAFPAGHVMSSSAGPVEMALGTFLKAPRAGTATLVGERVLTKEKPAQTISRLKGEIKDILEEGKDLGVRRDPDLHRMIDTPKTPEHEINQLQFIRDDLANKLKQNRADLDVRNAALPKSSVPSVDMRIPRAERNAVIEHLQSNPFVQAIKGRQGLPRKRDQLDLANMYFDQGGRLQSGPWGRYMPEEVRNILIEAAAKSAKSGSKNAGKGPRR